MPAWTPDERAEAQRFSDMWERQEERDYRRDRFAELEHEPPELSPRRQANLAALRKALAGNVGGRSTAPHSHANHRTCSDLHRQVNPAYTGG